MDKEKSNTIKIKSNTPPVIVEVDQSETSKLIISNAGGHGTLHISASSPSTNINVSTAECNTYKLNSVNISDLSIEVADTITLPSGSDAYVRNLGTTKKAQLEFGIPKGEKGEKGEDGAKVIWRIF